MASKTNKKVAMRSVKEKAPQAKAVAARPKGAASGTVRGKAKEAPAAKAAAGTKVSHAPRRDATGHLNSKYAADLHAMSVASAEDHTVDRAFLRRSKTLRDPLANELGREAVTTMTSAEDQSDQLQDVKLELDEEIGGPFVRTTAGQEFARGRDRSNPRGATREPFPKI